MAKAYDFPVTFTCRHESCDESFKQEAVEQVLKLSRYHGHIIDADVKVNGKQPSTRVEVTVRIPGVVVTASYEDYSRTVALDTAVEKARIQIKRYKDKTKDHRVPVSPEPSGETAEPSE